MATSRQRVQVSLSKSAQQLIPALARQHKVPVATFTSALIDTALELEEDRVLSKIGDKRFSTAPKKWLSHEDVWGHGNSRTTRK